MMFVSQLSGTRAFHNSGGKFMRGTAHAVPSFLVNLYLISANADKEANQASELNHHTLILHLLFLENLSITSLVATTKCRRALRLISSIFLTQPRPIRLKMQT